MFRKKKNLGTVTVFDDEPDNFNDLGLSTPSIPTAQRQQDRPLDQMTTQQLEALALGSAQTGKEATTRALRMANEAREVGVNTADTMKKQTDQLEKMSEDIEVVHDYLDKSENIIDKMTKPKLVRMFQKKKTNGKGLNKVRASRKDQEEREDLRKKGLSAVDLDKMEGESKDHLSMGELERNELFDGATDEVTQARRGRWGKKKEAVETKDPKAVREDYSQYSTGVAEVMRKQDEDLDQISDALADMHALAGAMNNELEYQDKLITEVQDFTVETSTRTKENARKIKRIK